jgi:hypothetical protein
MRALAWAIRLARRGPRLLSTRSRAHVA